MKLSTSTNILYERKHECYISMSESIRRCARAGFQYLDFGFAELAFSSKQFHTNAWKDEMMEYKKLADDLGMSFLQGHGCICDFSKEDHEQEQKMLQRSIEGARMLDIPWLVVHPSTFLANGRIAEYTLDKNVDFFRNLSRYARQFQVGIAIENMWGKSKEGIARYAITAKEVADLVDAVNEDNVGICWDVEHASVENLEQDASILQLGNRIKATHISDETGVNNIHVLPYTGKVQWENIAKAFASIRYDGAISLEIQHYLPGMPMELVDDAMRLAYQIGNHFKDEIEKNKVI